MDRLTWVKVALLGVLTLVMGAVGVHQMMSPIGPAMAAWVEGPLTPLAGRRPDSDVRASGPLQGENTVRAPLSGANCVAYCLFVDKVEGQRRLPIVREKKGAKFLVVDGLRYSLARWLPNTFFPTRTMSSLPDSIPLKPGQSRQGSFEVTEAVFMAGQPMFMAGRLTGKDVLSASPEHGVIVFPGTQAECAAILRKVGKRSSGTGRWMVLQSVGLLCMLIFVVVLRIIRGRR